MLKEIIATTLLSGSIGVKSLTIEPQNIRDVTTSSLSVDYYRSPNIFQGVYNFRDDFDYDDFQLYLINNVWDEDYQHTFTFDHEPNENGGMPYDRWAVPVSYQNYTYHCYEISFSFEPISDISIGFHCYDNGNHYDYWFNLTISENHSLSDNYFTWEKEFMINFHEQIVFDEVANKIFNFFMTSDVNEYITTYNGYLYFYNNLNYTLPFTAFGTEIIDTSMYLDLLTFSQGDSVRTSFWVSSMNYFQYDFTFFEFQRVNMPLKTPNRQWLIGNYKLSLTSKQNLSVIAFFGYVDEHTYANATFKDFFFSLVDTPVYFATSLLSFDLFGVNLFIALAGLLTLCCILMLIKKFW